MLSAASGITPDVPVLTYEIKNTRPIELIDLTASMMAFGEEFRRFAQSQGTDVAQEDVRLFIKEIRSGSIVAELVSLAQQLNFVTPDTAFVVQYAQYLNQILDFFRGAAAKKDPEKTLEKRDYSLISQIVDPVAKDSGSQLNIAARKGAIVNVNFTVNSIEANAIQNRIRRTIATMPETINGIHKDQVLYWYQVRDDSAEKPGDRAVIPRLSPRPVKVRFQSDDVKESMINRPENPFKQLYIIDVDVTEVNGKPVLYKIMDVKDTTERTE